MNTFFLTCAVLGGVILIAQLALGFAGADHHGGGHDASGHDGGSDGLQLFSARALSAAVAFFGIGAMSVSALRLPVPVAIAGGVVLGGVALYSVAFAMRSMMRFEHDGSIQIHRAIGVAATVYLPIPGAMAGTGKVTLTLQGRTVEYQAVTSEGQQLPTGAAVVIVDVRNDDTVEVVPLPSLDGVL